MITILGDPALQWWIWLVISFGIIAVIIIIAIVSILIVRHSQSTRNVRNINPHPSLSVSLNLKKKLSHLFSNL